MGKRRISATGVSDARNSKIVSSLFKQQVTVEDISVQQMRKLAKRELVYLVVIRMIEEKKEPTNEVVVTVNEDKTKTPYPMQVQTLLNEFSDVFLKDLPPRPPPQRQLDHRVELVPGAEPPHRAPYRMSP